MAEKTEEGNKLGIINRRAAVTGLRGFAYRGMAGVTNGWTPSLAGARSLWLSEAWTSLPHCCPAVPVPGPAASVAFFFRSSSSSSSSHSFIHSPIHCSALPLYGPASSVLLAMLNPHPHPHPDLLRFSLLTSTSISLVLYHYASMPPSP